MGDGCFVGDIRKCAIAIVVVESIGGHLQASWTAHHVDTLPFTELSLAGTWNRVIAEINVATDEQVCLSVSIVIQKITAGAPLVTVRAQSGLLGHVSECAIPVVVVERVLTPVGQ